MSQLSSTLRLLVLHLQTFWVAALLSLLLTPLSQQLAFRFGVLDRPDGRFKRHGRPVAYLGGLAVFAAFALTVGGLWRSHPGLLPLLLGSGAMLVVGLIDDLRPLRWWQKLPVEGLIATATVAGGLQLQHHGLQDRGATVAGIIWLTAAANALNMLDIADGLATGVALVGAAGLAAFGGLLGSAELPTAPLAGLALAGALLGFLPANRPPARQFLGDAGSLSVGFLLAGVALLTDYTDQPPLAVLGPLGILMVPFLDTFLVSTARLRRGASPFVGSNDHLGLRLRAYGLSPGEVALFGALLALIAAGWAHTWVLLPQPHHHLSLAAAALFWTTLFAWLWRMEVAEVGAPRPSMVRVEHPQKLRAVGNDPLERHHK